MDSHKAKFNMTIAIYYVLAPDCFVKNQFRANRIQDKSLIKL